MSRSTRTSARRSNVPGDELREEGGVEEKRRRICEGDRQPIEDRLTAGQIGFDEVRRRQEMPPRVECAPVVGQDQAAGVAGLGGGIAVLELDRAEIAQGGVQAAGVVDLLDESGQVGGDLLIGVVLGRGRRPRP